MEITTVPSAAHAVGTWLQGQGYVVATNLADEVQSDDDMRFNRMGIIQKSEEGTREQGFARFFSHKRPVRRLIGDVLFENDRYRASLDRWVIVAYGEDCIQTVRGIARDLMRTFKVYVVVELDPGPAFERFRKKKRIGTRR